MVKFRAARRLAALILTLSVLVSVLPTVSSAEDTGDTIYAADRLWKQIDALCGTVAKRGMSAGESAYAALSDDVFALVEASGTADPGSLAANGDFIRWVDRETGIPCCYSPDHEAAMAGASTQTQTAAANSVLRSVEPTRTAAQSSSCPQSLNVGLLQPYWESDTEYKASGFCRYSRFYVQQANLLAQKTGGEVIRFSMGNVTPDTIAFSLQNCGIILINSHGSTDYKSGSDRTSCANSSYLWLTSDYSSIAEIKTILDPEDYMSTHIGPYGEYSDVYFSGGDYCVNGTVIANHMTTDSPSSLVYFCCCLAMATDGLAVPLRDMGVEAVIGFSQTVTTKGDYAYMLSITNVLLNGGSLSDAMAVAKVEVGIIDPYKKSNPCYPIVVSSADPYPGRGYVDAPQTVNSDWHLSTQKVTFSVPSTVSPIPTVCCGIFDSVTLPAADPIDGYTFAGWSTIPIGSETSAPTLFYENSTYEPLFNTTLYAVYSRKEAHTGGYVKLTTAPSVFNGDYLIVCEDSGIVFNASAAGIDGSGNYLSVNIDDHRISSSPAVEAAAVTIRRVTGKPYYSIQLPDSRYIGNLGSGAGINTTANITESYANLLTFHSQDQSVTVMNTAENYRFQFNSGAQNNRFSYYDAGKTNAGLHSVCFYRKDTNALVDVYTTSPDTACAHTAWSSVVTPSTCLHGGYTTKTCAQCGMTWTVNQTNALGHWFDKGVVTPASDDSFGYTTYTCQRAGCGHSYQTDFNGLDYQVTLRVLGSDWQTLTVDSYDGTALPDPAVIPDGYAFAGWSETPLLAESATADLIDDLYYPMEDAAVYAIFSRSVDGVVFYSMTQTALKIYSASLILNGKIDIAFTAQLPAGYSDPRMVVNGTEITDCSAAQGNCVFVYSGINPQCIGDVFTATLYATHDGTEESVSVQNYSVRQYCVHKLADGTISDELRTLLSDLLAYGSAAQLYTGYMVDTLITDGDDISNPMYSFLFYLNGYKARFEGTADANTRWINAALTLTNSVAMTFRFFAEDTNGLTVTVGINGRARTYTEFEAVDCAANTYEIVFDGINANEFADSVTASFARNSVPVGNTLYYSVNAYVQSNLNSADNNLSYLVTALYNYGAAARSYTETQTNN